MYFSYSSFFLVFLWCLFLHLFYFTFVCYLCLFVSDSRSLICLAFAFALALAFCFQFRFLLPDLWQAYLDEVCARVRRWRRIWEGQRRNSLLHFVCSFLLYFLLLFCLFVMLLFLFLFFLSCFAASFVYSLNQFVYAVDYCCFQLDTLLVACFTTNST
jgi:hypothetical protein